ncbi:MAG TPA: hypothetical protein DD473_12050 [Planctomycetaceae bacterium]|nr:hypothetical protein [Planctomycetaceae bacterium]
MIIIDFEFRFDQSATPVKYFVMRIYEFHILLQVAKTPFFDLPSRLIDSIPVCKSCTSRFYIAPCIIQIIYHIKDLSVFLF